MSLQNSDTRANGAAIIAANFPAVAFYALLIVQAVTA